MSRGLGSSGLADYVRLEFRPADRATAIFALRRAVFAGRRRRTAHGLVRRLRSWWATPKTSREAVIVGE